MRATCMRTPKKCARARPSRASSDVITIAPTLVGRVIAAAGPVARFLVGFAGPLNYSAYLDTLPAACARRVAARAARLRDTYGPAS